MKLNEIKATNWTLSLEKQGEIVQGLAEISQCLRVLITTRKGSDPLRPTFGCDIYLYQDLPINQAIPRMVKSVSEAIAIWETRINVTSIGYALGDDGSVTTFTIEWTEKTTQQSSSTKILINGTN